VLRLIILGTLFAMFGVLAFQTTALSGAAAAYPGYVLGALLVLLTGIAVSELRQRGKLELDAELAQFWPALSRPRAALAGFVALWLAYALALNTLGFLAATALAMAAGLWLLGQRRWLRVAVGAVVFSLAMAILVKTVLYIPAPLAAPDLALERLIFLLRTGA
jgi:hypothetical protein